MCSQTNTKEVFKGRRKRAITHNDSKGFGFIGTDFADNKIDQRDVDNINPFVFDEFIEKVRCFHTYLAPGVILGGFMVKMAKEQMPKGILYNAVSETYACLPDAIQLLTPCTTGNGRLKVVHLGHFALALYNKETGEGIRVGIDHERLKRFAEINSWLFKLKPKNEQNESLLLEEIRIAGTWILTTCPVKIDVQTLRLPKKKKVIICPSCGEAYPSEYGAVCMGCQGKGPYLHWPVDFGDNRLNRIDTFKLL
jgi:formylmethanofuran dehydrogenase subunit E